MDLKRHARIPQIQRISGYVYIFLTFILILGSINLVIDMVGWLSQLWSNSGKVSFDFSLSTSFPFQSALKLSGSANREDLLIKFIDSMFIDLLILWAISCFRKLIKCFYMGDIFTQQAVLSARRVIQCGWLFVGYKLSFYLLDCILQSYKEFGQHQFSFNFHFESERHFVILLVLGVFWALSFALVWALEIGRDLHEESELTI